MSIDTNYDYHVVILMCESSWHDHDPLCRYESEPLS